MHGDASQGIFRNLRASLCEIQLLLSGLILYHRCAMPAGADTATVSLFALFPYVLVLYEWQLFERILFISEENVSIADCTNFILF